MEASQKPNLEEYLKKSIPEWTDDGYMQGMFAAFSQSRSVNPESWDSRMSFWRQVIQSITDNGFVGDGSSVLTIAQPAKLSQILMRKNLFPLGIEHALSSMVEKRELVPLSEFKRFISEERQQGTSTLFGKIWSSLSWIFSFPNNSDDPKDDFHLKKLPNEPLVCIELVKEATSILISYADAKELSIDRILTVPQILKTLNAKRTGKTSISSEKDILLILEWLKSSNLAHACKLDEQTIVYAVGSRGPVTEDEKSMMRLILMKDRLQNQIVKLTLQLENRNDKLYALHQLRRKKLIEGVRDQRLSNSASLEQIILRIQSSHTDQQVFEAFKTGQDSLQSIIKKSGMTVERIDDLMGSIEEVLLDQKQIEEAMQRDLSIESNEAELEAELNQLVLEGQDEMLKPRKDGTLIEAVDQTMSKLSVAEQMNENVEEEVPNTTKKLLSI